MVTGGYQVLGFAVINFVVFLAGAIWGGRRRRYTIVLTYEPPKEDD